MAKKQKFRGKDPERKEYQKNYLHLISGGKDIFLGRLDGERLIYQSKNVFKSFIDPSFINFKQSGKLTLLTGVKIYKNIAEGSFGKIFWSLDGSWSASCFTQDQIIEFCMLFPEWIKSNISLLFLCKKYETNPIDETNPQSNIMVVSVSVDEDGLLIDNDQLDRTSVWPKESCYVIVPKIVT